MLRAAAAVRTKGGAVKCAGRPWWTQRGCRSSVEQAEPSEKEEVDPLQRGIDVFNGESHKRTLLVANLPFTIKAATVASHFEQIGEVLFVDILRRPSGKSFGRAVVEFASERSVDASLAQLVERELEGRRLVLKRHGASFTSGAPVSRRLLLNNLPGITTDSHLKRIGESFGTVQQAALTERTSYDGQPRCGTILFAYEYDAQVALYFLDERILNGRIIDVSYAPLTLKTRPFLRRPL